MRISLELTDPKGSLNSNYEDLVRTKMSVIGYEVLCLLWFHLVDELKEYK